MRRGEKIISGFSRYPTVLAPADDRHTDKVADDAESDTHAAPALRCRAAMDGVAGLAHLAEGQVVEGLEYPHCDNGGRMAFEADVSLDTDQHVRSAMVAGMAV